MAKLQKLLNPKCDSEEHKGHIEKQNKYLRDNLCGTKERSKSITDWHLCLWPMVTWDIVMGRIWCRVRLTHGRQDSMFTLKCTQLQGLLLSEAHTHFIAAAHLPC